MFEWLNSNYITHVFNKGDFHAPSKDILLTTSIMDITNLIKLTDSDRLKWVYVNTNCMSITYNELLHTITRISNKYSHEPNSYELKIEDRDTSKVNRHCNYYQLNMLFDCASASSLDLGCEYVNTSNKPIEIINDIPFSDKTEITQSEFNEMILSE